MSERSPVIFLVKNRALGDSLMGLSSVSYFRKLYPKGKIIYAVPAWVYPIYQDVNTDADFIYPLKLNSLSDIVDLYTDLINLKIDLIHEMHQTGTGNKVFSFFSFLKGIPYTFHNHHYEFKTKIIDQGIKKELIQRDLDGICSFYGNINMLPSFLDFAPKLKRDTSINKMKRVILGVVATRSTKMWPLENYIELSKKILNYDAEIEIVIPLSKSKEDVKIKNELVSLIKNEKIKIVQFPLNELPKYFFESTIYIGNDTGLKHLAVSTNMKTITIFGPEPIKEWHPYDLKNHKALFIDNLPCRTRKHHYCGLSTCDLTASENLQCMKKINVESVFLEFKNNYYM